MLSDLTFIDSTEKLEAFAALTPSRIGFDSEFTRKSTFSPEPELLQISTEDRIGLIDLRADIDFGAIKLWFQTDDIVRVGFDVEQDLEVLQLVLSDDIGLVEDVQLGVGFLRDGPLHSFAWTVNHLVGIELDKSMQKSRWSSRPLSEQQLAYAAMDVEHLLKLWEMVESQLKSCGRFDWYCEERTRRQRTMHEDPMLFPGKSNGILRLGEVGLRILPLLNRWRNEQAQRLNIPTSWVLSNEGLMLLAVDKPITDDRLARATTRNRRGGFKRAVDAMHRRARSKARKSRFVPPRKLSDLVNEVGKQCDQLAQQQSIHEPLLSSRKDLLFVLRSYIADGKFPAWYGEWRVDLTGGLITQAATKYKLRHLMSSKG